MVVLPGPLAVSLAWQWSEEGLEDLVRVEYVSLFELVSKRTVALAAAVYLVLCLFEHCMSIAVSIGDA